MWGVGVSCVRPMTKLFRLRMSTSALDSREELKKKQREYYLMRKPLIQEQYHKNKEAIKEHKRLYYLKNKETIKENSNEYYRKNWEAVKLQKRVYHKRRREERRRRFKDYYLRNKEAIRVRQKLYRVSKKKVGKNRGWRDPLQVKGFFEMAMEKLHVRDREDWYRISRNQLIEIGGARLFSVFGSLGKALKFAFPEVDWDQSKFSLRGKKSTQRWLRVVLEQILPSKTDILEDFLHPDLLWDDMTRETNRKMELDIWIPEYNLAFEYQGEHHYYDIHSAYGPSGTLAFYTGRDSKKRITCDERGITLISIPYWWDGQKESLTATLHQIVPRIFPKTDSLPIPSHPPDTTKQKSKLMKSEISSSLMHGQEWTQENDPTGWIISEKLDGYRAYWDGSNLISKNGKPFPVPSDFTCTLPVDLCLDGELWIGYEDFNRLPSIFKKESFEMDPKERAQLWKDVKYCVFDAPKHPGNYFERHSFASNSISGCSPNICMIPITECLGRGHLQTILNQITQKKGEGVMLYHPTSHYTSGRTPNLLKVKAYKEDDVKFIECNPNSYSYIVEQKNGANCIVKCGGWDYMFPPPPGTVLTVKHNGIFALSQKMKYPYLLRVRPDLNWEQLKLEETNKIT